MKTRKLILLLLITSLFAGCSKSIYIINPHNVSGFEEANQLKASANLSVQEEVGYVGHLNLAYSINDKIAVLGSAGVFSEGIINATGSYTDLGMGYYKKTNSNIVFESYFGYGYGSFFNKDISLNKTRVNYHKLFNQSSFMFKSKDQLFEAVFSVRTSAVNTLFTNLDEDYQEYYAPIIQDPYSILLEPNLAFRYGLKDVKAEVYINKVISLKSKSFGLFPQTSAGIGLVYFINNK